MSSRLGGLLDLPFSWRNVLYMMYVKSESESHSSAVLQLFGRSKGDRWPLLLLGQDVSHPTIGLLPRRRYEVTSPVHRIRHRGIRETGIVLSLYPRYAEEQSTPSIEKILGMALKCVELVRYVTRERSITTRASFRLARGSCSMKETFATLSPHPSPPPPPSHAGHT